MVHEEIAITYFSAEILVRLQENILKFYTLLSNNKNLKELNYGKFSFYLFLYF